MPVSNLYRRLGATSTDGTAATLLATLAAMPAEDPRRPATRREAIEAWLPLAQHLARRYADRGESADDLLHVAVVGLIKAVDRFDLSRRVDFPAFAIPTILGEIKRHFRDRTWAVRIPRHLQERWADIRLANSALAHRLGRAPTITDIAEHLGLSDEQVLDGIEGGRAYIATSLSTPIDDESGLELADTLAAPDQYDLTDNRIALHDALDRLDKRGREIVLLRFRDNLTQAEISERIGISQMHVSRLLAAAVSTLRTDLLGDGIGPGHIARTRATKRSTSIVARGLPRRTSRLPS
ncbi:SigB/SigF/SigG family RNA polymerase sigma factor [Actinoplanes sp. CA-030573]|uniref:SigB/SigF/SigG family RNA polymerase sigma factor n=1 Tax=Actinoplanes sp. CA-030573 TaxID=3239898 RepID=UPI003D8E504E